MNTLHQSSATWRVAQRAPGRPSSGRWLWGLLRHSSAPNHVVPPDGAADEGVVQDARQIRRALTALSRHRVLLTLQSPDGRHFGTAVLGTTGTQDLVLDWRAGNRDPSGGLPPSLSAMASGDRGLLFFTLHGLAARAGAQLQARWPDTLIQVQSRRHYRVGCRMDGLFITQPGTPFRHLVCDISEEGVGLLLEPSAWPHSRMNQSAMLQLGNLMLPVPALQWVHHGLGAGAGAGRSAGARLGGMAPEHVRQLRRWLAARQAASPAPRHDQV